MLNKNREEKKHHASNISKALGRERKPSLTGLTGTTVSELQMGKNAKLIKNNAIKIIRS